MTKFSVTKSGIPLDKSLYTWDEDTMTFASKQSNLVLDFSYVDGVTFHISSQCILIAGNGCNVNAGALCTFDTGMNCVFIASHDCVFNTGAGCTFSTDVNCMFRVGFSCIFNVGYDCYGCRNDINTGFKIPANKKIKLNDFSMPGYTFIKEAKEKKDKPSYSGKIVEIDGKKYKLVEA